MMKRVGIMLLTAMVGMCLTANGQMLQDIQGKPVETEKQKRVDVSLGAGVNGGWMVSRVYTPMGDYSWKGGTGYFGELNCVFAKGFGFGADYEHSETSYPVSFRVDSKLKLDFVLPYFLYSTPAGADWLFRAMIGIGYAHYRDDDKGQGGFGVKSAVGIEYQVNKHMGLALEIERRSATFSEPEEFTLYKNRNESFGYSRLAASLGLMIHL